MTREWRLTLGSPGTTDSAHRDLYSGQPGGGGGWPGEENGFKFRDGGGADTAAAPVMSTAGISGRALSL